MQIKCLKRQAGVIKLAQPKIIRHFKMQAGTSNWHPYLTAIKSSMKQTPKISESTINYAWKEKKKTIWIVSNKMSQKAGRSLKGIHLMLVQLRIGSHFKRQAGVLELAQPRIIRHFKSQAGVIELAQPRITTRFKRQAGLLSKGFHVWTGTHIDYYKKQYETNSKISEVAMNSEQLMKSWTRRVLLKGNVIWAHLQMSQDGASLGIWKYLVFIKNMSYIIFKLMHLQQCESAFPAALFIIQNG